jgi:REP element-mobilizing transposase RayT
MRNDEPIAFFLTWSTYGTWLPGDERGWVEYRRGFQLPDPVLELECTARMSEAAVRLLPHDRQAVHEQLAETCKFRGWILHAANCRSNHAHVVVTADVAPKTLREQLKAWCTRRLKQLHRDQSHEPPREQWWAERGSIRWLHTQDDLDAAILYVRDGQDDPRRFRNRDG